MPLIVSGHQPTYLPWLGLFHKISLANFFVIMDDAQYLEQDWNNRNKLKGANGPFWLTVPIEKPGVSGKAVRDIRIDAVVAWSSPRHWQIRHWKAIEVCYRNAPFWERYAPALAELYTQRPYRWLWDVDHQLLLALLDALDLRIHLVISSEAGFSGRKSDLVLDHAVRLKADICVLGTNGRSYIIEDDFIRAGVSLYFQNYQHPVYSQRFGNFVPHLSVLDLLMNCGPRSREILCRGNIDKSFLLKESVSGPRRIEERGRE